ncbi:MAG: hypothetical protein A2275_12320 [Bacteroidetes bacterium RIFOXYA12_FULL_35_11]|nr:MAG: hypothetical protein A2X01_02375 [Bacteroidetes bacterium GWF2_35_48]OFY77866.1 MAG: hypothetical protein A2275_12320 [Bacteroidetes bacterium RIFOXYA12_FULL_35_11]OFY93904.1 MAG: hypothetical protein A2309_02610 [Bacteroidetes bacterium RIFOXYB2_FULL_35_7]OFY97966.1 MAG: hypothetical protein A2491_10070 [Bacteroidetes bacterium RIFOXYC12_FULL_35_7]HBX50336.1 hypothetical protein [Bacteroidales bacterium]
MALIITILYLFNPLQIPDQWQVLFENDQIKIEKMQSDCLDAVNGINQSKILLKFTNKTTAKLKISYEKKLIYTLDSGNDKDTKTDRTYDVILEAGQSKQGTCENRDKNLFVFEKYLDRSASELKKYELINIKTQTVE